MQNGSQLGPEELRTMAAEAVAKSGLQQKKVAEKLGVAESWISRALNNSGDKYAGAQARIIAALTDYEVERRTSYVLKRKR